jgi:hypothetical protein
MAFCFRWEDRNKGQGGLNHTAFVFAGLFRRLKFADHSFIDSVPDSESNEAKHDQRDYDERPAKISIEERPAKININELQEDHIG